MSCFQARWSLLLDADMRDLVGGGSFSVKLAAIAVRRRRVAAHALLILAAGAAAHLRTDASSPLFCSRR